MWNVNVYVILFLLLLLYLSVDETNVACYIKIFVYNISPITRVETLAMYNVHTGIISVTFVKWSTTELHNTLATTPMFHIVTLSFPSHMFY